MIGKLKGLVDEVGDDWVILDVGGVGYEVHCPARTLAALPPRGEAASLSIETHLRQDMIRLFGFAEPQEREWFRALQTVQGVGSKVALAVLSVLAPGDLAKAVTLNDTAAISQAPGVGAKVAQRIATELKSKAAKLGGGTFAAADTQSAVAGGDGAAMADAVSALVNLGYGRPQATEAVARVMMVAGEGAGAAELIRHGLKELAR
ncbi:Holliday junction ATP-dependent DNA helicase RuvA [hydrothermal vent metagenome]|uniref:Holliday junction ATP-dependent DNA helicase RuvA n=1 Tax=hydrothermal vent metagenome TaxID=652676 RepID=A0A3B0TGI5_9ZZZZ